ncbi:hypothetical protein C1J03_02300 [Sulfitobacter sp. SK012]|nr:hypothetical protein C1J03_02300 [Sulfitobacter sp. SK012]
MYFIVIYLTAYFNWWLRKTEKNPILWFFGLSFSMFCSVFVFALVDIYFDNVIVSELLRRSFQALFLVVLAPWVFATFVSFKTWKDTRDQAYLNIKTDGSRAIQVKKLIKLGKKR